MPPLPLQDCFAVVTAGVEETTKLLENKFDYIFFTGMTQIIPHPLPQRRLHFHSKRGIIQTFCTPAPSPSSTGTKPGS